MPYRSAPAVALLCPASSAVRFFKSPNALRRAMVSEGFSCQGLWHGRRWYRHESDWIAWDLKADEALELRPLFDQNKGLVAHGHVHRSTPIEGISRADNALPARRARVIRAKGEKARWERKYRRSLNEGEPALRNAGEKPASRYDDDFYRRPERSWKRHRDHQWKPLSR